MKKETEAEAVEQLNAFIDGELDKKAHEEILGRLDGDHKLKSELCDTHRIKELMTFAYPLEAKKNEKSNNIGVSYKALAASLLLVLGVGFISGYFSNALLSNGQSVATTELFDSNNVSSMQSVAFSQNKPLQNKVIIYLGYSEEKKFAETLDKAEELLAKYRSKGTEVYVVTSAGGIDLLRDNKTDVQKRIIQMKDLNPSLHFVACNNQIYHLHKKGQEVNLVEGTEVAPSAVQFVVDHLKNGWRYIAI